MAVKLHLYTICWNEEKMLPHFLKYYAAFCEKICVYDNFSTDKTAEICAAFPNVEVFEYDSGNEIRDDIYLKIKNEVWKKSRGEADFVIVCDVDEFIYHENLDGFLSGAKSNGISVMRCEGYNMISDKFPAADKNIFEEVQEGVRSINFDKACVFDPFLVEEINYSPGAHGCFPVGKIKYSDHELKLLHFKYLDLNYILLRYKEFGTRLSKFNRANSLGHHYLFSSFRIKKEFRQIWAKRKKLL